MALRVVTLLDAELCLECRFSEKIVVDGERVIKCHRKDCDNWGATVEPKKEEVKE
jgi:hypothetical protein